MVNENFTKVVNEIGDIGRTWHENRISTNVERNSTKVEKTIRDLPELSVEKKKAAIVISAGPSLHRNNCFEKIKKSDFKGTLICVDGSYVSCLRNGIVPDYVLTLDPHPTRIVRWFGDRNLEENEKGDDYFSRQDLDVDFRTKQQIKNNENIEIINEMASKTKLIISTTAPQNVEERTREAGFDRYWWNPLVDNPREEGSLTRKFYNLVKAPCMNTGGTVGTAAWVFAENILKIESIALLGVDLGYFIDTPKKMTQTIDELISHVGNGVEMKDFFPEFEFPLTGERSYADPTYYWYRRNFLELLSKAKNSRTYNCSEAGTLFGDGVECIYFDDFLNMHKS